MCYKCSQCGHAADNAGNCPTCNVPMNEEQHEEKAEGTEEAVQESSEAPKEEPAQ